MTTKPEKNKKSTSSISVDPIDEGSPVSKQEEEGEAEEVFEADGKPYKFNAKEFYYEGVRYKAADVLKNKVLLAELVKLKAGVLTELKSEET